MRKARGVLRGGAVALASLLAVTLAPGLATAEPAAGPTGQPDENRPDRTLELDGVPPGSHQVTLITGDRVSLVEVGDGRYLVDVQKATRPDGSTPDFVDVQHREDGLYVIPGDAFAPLAADRLDEELFDVAALARFGYADGANLPLLVEYGPAGARSLAATAETLPGTVTAELESIDAAALTVPAEQTSQFWASVRAPAANGRARASLSREVERIWLDGKAELLLDESVPQVGAPEAWDMGLDGTGVTVAVLDTGIDATHPDLAGKIVEARSFIPDVPVNDTVGHGTHVASTIVGSGAASDGQFRGVAPGADLLVGKVCPNRFCPFSAMIDGMEWAAPRADVVSMSIGGNPTDGTDPLSQTVNELTAETDTLFVIAAGNDGRLGDFTVSSPAAADAALAVGAVDKSDQLASFSSRGPRAPELLGDYAIKPEIVAPGVDITAAFASGAGGGPEQRYASASGTSMATPHVSGGAAILLQQHPEWTDEQLKAALVSSAEDVGYTVYEQGGGRLDLAQAVSQQVRVSPALADFRSSRIDQPQPPETITLTYTNPTDAAVTLDLDSQVATVDGDPVPDGTLTLSATTVAVPAGGTATVDVTLDRSELDSATYSGRIVATADGVRLTTPVGFAVVPEAHRLTIDLVEHSKQDGQQPFVAFVNGLDGAALGYAEAVYSYSYPYPPVTIVVPEGTYRVGIGTDWFDDENRRQYATLVKPQVTVDQDVTVVIDANDAVPVTVSAPEPNARYDSQADFWYTNTAGLSSFSLTWAEHLWVLPSEPVTVGESWLTLRWVLGAPPVTMTVTAPERRELSPFGGSYDVRVNLPFPAGRHEFPVVPVKIEQPYTSIDLSGVDVRGALVLVPACTNVIDDAVYTALRDAGAVGALIVGTAGSDGCPLNPFTIDNPLLPTATLPSTETEFVTDLVARGPVSIEVTATPHTPFLYSLHTPELDSVPDRPLHHTFERRDLTAVDHHLHGSRPTWFWLRDETFGPSAPGVLAGGPSVFLRGPRTVRQYVPVSDDPHWRWMFAKTGTPDPACNLWAWTAGPCEQSLDRHPRRGRDSIHWLEDPASVGAQHTPERAAEIGLPAVCAGCRQGDTFAAIANVTGPQPSHWRGYVDGADSEVHLYRDGEELTQRQVTFPRGVFTGTVPLYDLPAEAGSYRLTQEVGNLATEWRFGSSRPDEDATPDNTVCIGTVAGSEEPCAPEPLVFLRYDAGVGLDNTLAAPGVAHLRIDAYHQAPDAPRVAGLRLWASVDGGQTWHRQFVWSRGDGEFGSLLFLPFHSRTSGAVSLRAEAWDAAGNRVTQTVTDAIGLRDRFDH